MKLLTAAHTRMRFLSLALLTLLTLLPNTASGQPGFLSIRDGYFFDNQQQDYFIPRGIAYQIWNVPVGANQSLDQVAYDFREFRKLGANSVRAELVWSELEIAPDVYDWSKADDLINLAETLGLRLFLVIGYQYPPKWFPEDWFSINDQHERSDVLNYTHPEARSAYQNHIRALIDRYKDRTVIGGWILGNEFAFFDLWEDPYRYPVRRFLGYDPVAQQSFRDWLALAYQNDIEHLNHNWATAYSSFSEAEMPETYPEERDDPRYQDLVQWRMTTIGDFISLAAIAARSVDPNHLITYSMVGGIFNGRDSNHTCEDHVAIVDACAKAGAPLDFWSINNYAWALMGNEMRSADFGISKYQEQIKLPIMISETGHSSTENLYQGAGPRQAKAIVSQVWEGLMSGVVGVHIFHWNDRRLYTEDYFLRERGFGFVEETRIPKPESYDRIADMFHQMSNLRVDTLFGGSTPPKADVQLFWSTNSLSVWASANQENAMLWGTLKRAGYQPGIISDEDFAHQVYTNSPILLLSRARQLTPQQIDQLATDVLESGTHIHANADIPGMLDAYLHPNTNWNSRMDDIFGINVSQATNYWDKWARIEDYGDLTLQGVTTVGPFHPNYQVDITTWKIWHGIQNNSAEVLLTHQGVDNSQPPMPALTVKSHAKASAALNTYAFADTFGAFLANRQWSNRTDVIEAVYQNRFNVQPTLQLSGPGRVHVTSDFRHCANNTTLISLLNESTNSAQITVTCPSLLASHTVENLLTGTILERNSDGTLAPITLAGDDYVLLYAYDEGSSSHGSLIHPYPARIRFLSAPPVVWPNSQPYTVQVAHDLPSGTAGNLQVRLCKKSFPQPDYGFAIVSDVTGQDTTELQILVADADPQDPGYTSSFLGTDYVWRAELVVGDTVVSQIDMPVQLYQGVQPANGIPWPTDLQSGQSYSLPVAWEILPSYLEDNANTPLERADQWATLQSYDEWYTVRLELHNPQGIVATAHHSTSSGSGSTSLNITVPLDSHGPYSWIATTQPAPATYSRNLLDSFEERDLGAEFYPSFFFPWESYVYSNSGDAVRLRHGIGHSYASEGKQSAYVGATNSPITELSGFGISRPFEETISLPTNTNSWENYLVSFDFSETNGLPCTLEMRLQDANGNYRRFSTNYPANSGWVSVSAPISQFVPSPNGPDFNPTNLTLLVFDAQMLQPSLAYQGYFDKIQFPLASLYDGFETNTFGQRTDTTRTNPLIHPWTTFTWPNNGTELWQNEGVHLNASHGSKSAFLVVSSPYPAGTSGCGLERNFSETWPLPADTNLWSNYWFSFDFMNKHPDADLPYTATVYAQVKSTSVDGKPGVLQSPPVTYTPNPSQPNGHWITVGGKLSDFIPIPANGSDFSEFNPFSVESIAVGITIEQSEVQYVISFDNIRFEGPVSTPFTIAPLQLEDSFETRTISSAPDAASPWSFYDYAENFNSARISQGIHTLASHGQQSAYITVANPASPGSFSGFGLEQYFLHTWSLPTDASLWTNYTFSFDYREPNHLPTTLQFQLKDAHGNWLELNKAYTPTTTSWDTLSGNFADLQLPSFLEGFDASKIARITLNAMMHQPNSVYSASFDNIRLNGPMPIPLANPPIATYSSTNDARDSDGDGLLDSAETGTGIFVSPLNSGTSPYIADSDGDGATDGEEIVAGTNPTSPADVLQLSLSAIANTTINLTWEGKAAHTYSVSSLEGDLDSDTFTTVPGMEAITPSTNGPLTRTDTRPQTNTPRYYRVSVSPPQAP
ncbi:MAG: hypothetical protein RI897_3648 [Verrucomicrobiota bacterium]|jgi:hypothetical protein